IADGDAAVRAAFDEWASGGTGRHLDAVRLRFPASVYAPHAGQDAAMRCRERQRHARPIGPPAPARLPLLTLAGGSRNDNGEFAIDRGPCTAGGPFDWAARSRRPFDHCNVDGGETVRLRSVGEARIHV